jgi:hypothetical protein
MKNHKYKGKHVKFNYQYIQSFQDFAISLRNMEECKISTRSGKFHKLMDFENVQKVAEDFIKILRTVILNFLLLASHLSFCQKPTVLS